MMVVVILTLLFVHDIIVHDAHLLSLLLGCHCVCCVWFRVCLINCDYVIWCLIVCDYYRLQDGLLCNYVLYYLYRFCLVLVCLLTGCVFVF